jgi:hypothetical protein
MSENFQNEKIKIVFSAIPKTFTSLNGEKNKINNKYFYLLIGVYILKTKEYAIVKQIFKKNSRSSTGLLYKTIDSEVKICKSKLDVINFIYQFLDLFDTHERMVNSVNIFNKKIKFGDFLDSIPSYLEEMIYYFSNKKSK